jgi:hypothetical protein
MAACGQTAVLIITREIEGTSTSVARTRLELRCSLEAGHGGVHRDETRGEEWEGGAGGFKAVFRHEDGA